MNARLAPPTSTGGRRRRPPTRTSRGAAPATRSAASSYWGHQKKSHFSETTHAFADEPLSSFAFRFDFIIRLFPRTAEPMWRLTRSRRSVVTRGYILATRNNNNDNNTVAHHWLRFPLLLGPQRMDACLLLQEPLKNERTKGPLLRFCSSLACPPNFFSFSNLRGSKKTTVMPLSTARYLSSLISKKKVTVLLVRKQREGPQKKDWSLRLSSSSRRKSVRRRGPLEGGGAQESRRRSVCVVQ